MSRLAIEPFKSDVPRPWIQPPEMAALWGAFISLGDGFGPSDVLAWQTLHGVTLTPWEAETLLIMSRAADKRH